MREWKLWQLQDIATAGGFHMNFCLDFDQQAIQVKLATHTLGQMFQNLCVLIDFYGGHDLLLIFGYYFIYINSSDVFEIF